MKTMSLLRAISFSPAAIPRASLRKYRVPDLAEDAAAVPVVPFVQGDADIFALERVEPLAIVAVGGGHAADRLGHLPHVGRQVAFWAAIEMLADKVHVVGAVLQHAFAPRSHVADGDQLDRRVDGPHGRRRTRCAS